jgi:predicted DNA-binding protein with PD1-like motif
VSVEQGRSADATATRLEEGNEVSRRIKRVRTKKNLR